MRKITIVSSDEIILYQPTLLNLYELLKQEFDVNLVSFNPEYLGNKKEETKNIEYISPNRTKKLIFKKTDLIFNAILKRVNRFIIKNNFRSYLYRRYQSRLLEKTIGKYKGNIIIAVDPMPLFIAQKIFGNVHFLSLEIIPQDPYLKKIDFNKIISVIIQNPYRYNYLFNQKQIRTFYIQNSPTSRSKYMNIESRDSFIWAGTILKDFAIFDCIELIKTYPQFSLTMKGGIEKKTRQEIEKKYKSLIDRNCLRIDNEYLKSEEYIKYVSQFKIGFCFYNWSLIWNNFNYETAPSGKLFVYLAAGVPVIAPNIIAFKFLEDTESGILVDNYNPDTLYNAVIRIESNYEHYSKNAYKTFDLFSFEVNAIPFMNFLKNNDY